MNEMLRDARLLVYDSVVFLKIVFLCVVRVLLDAQVVMTFVLFSAVVFDSEFSSMLGVKPHFGMELSPEDAGNQYSVLKND